jgi:hypothetical protein
MNRLFISFSTTVIILIAASANAFAAPESFQPKYEVGGGANSSLRDHDETGMNSTRTFSLNGQGDYFVTPALEVGAKIGVSITNSDDVTRSEFTVQVGPTYNFSDEIANAFFVQALVGLDLNFRSKYPNYSEVAYTIAFGKRFEIIPHVTWKPQIALLGFGSGTQFTDGDVSAIRNWTIIPFQFSLLF